LVGFKNLVGLLKFTGCRLQFGTLPK